MTQIFCSIPGCDQRIKHLGLKLCNAHYHRYRRHGDPLAGRSRQVHSGLVHGTINGYTTYRCRCSECREANRVFGAAARAKRLARPVPDAMHGTVNGYYGYGCRCEKCQQARRVYSRQRQEKSESGGR